MKVIPETARPYDRTSVFTVDTVPAGLLRDHQTKGGVWGKIHVVSGRVRYTLSATGQTFDLTPDRPGIVEPDALHYVEPVDDAAFYVEFWR